MRWCWLVACCMATASCGGARRNDPEDRCRVLVDTLCRRAVGCLVEERQLPASREDAAVQRCFAGTTAQARCSEVTATRESYDTCLTEAASLVCPDVVASIHDGGGVPIPQSCQGALVTP